MLNRIKETVVDRSSRDAGGERQLFLTEDQVDCLTGIRRGATVFGTKHTKYALQVSFLRGMGICFFQNARGKPVVLLSSLEVRPTTISLSGWQPSVLQRR